MVHKGKSPTRKGLPEGRKGCVRAGEHEKATGERPPAGHPMKNCNLCGRELDTEAPESVDCGSNYLGVFQVG